MKLCLRQLGLCDYLATWQQMREFTDARDDDALDEIWLLEHPPVFTQGRNGDPKHLLSRCDIPVIESDRGGQVTYHGPGQLIVYTLFNLVRLNMGVRSLVSGLENAVISTLSQYGLTALARRDAPGVYVDGKKIASLGLRVRKGCSYHGLSLNVNLDLAPFAMINPCGYAGLQVTSLAQCGAAITTLEASIPLLQQIMQEFGYDGLVTEVSAETNKAHCDL